MFYVSWYGLDTFLFSYYNVSSEQILLLCIDHIEGKGRNSWVVLLHHYMHQCSRSVCWSVGRIALWKNDLQSIKWLLKPTYLPIYLCNISDSSDSSESSDSCDSSDRSDSTDSIDSSDSSESSDSSDSIDSSDKKSFDTNFFFFFFHPLKLWQNLKTQILTNLKKQIMINWTTQIVTKLKNTNFDKTPNSNCDKNQKHKLLQKSKTCLWQNSKTPIVTKLKKTQIVIKIKNPNCDTVMTVVIVVTLVTVGTVFCLKVVTKLKNTNC